MVAGFEWQQDRPDHENTDGSIIMMTDQLWYKNLELEDRCISFLAFLRNAYQWKARYHVGTRNTWETERWD